MTMTAEEKLAEIEVWAQDLLNEAAASTTKCNGVDCGTCTQGTIAQSLLLRIQDD